ncbi:MAG: TonB-dependent receptor [Prevotellaceae bacterium]|jgi:hypothetical protein|nr:TonB-dependent receptor [Prevotellaceae bacterium]
MKKFTLGMLASLLLSFCPLWAQQVQKIDPKVEVQRDYEGGIVEITKPKPSIVVPDSISKFSITMDYSIFDMPFHDLYSFAPLPFIHLSATGKERLPNVHIRLGLLMPFSPRADLFVQAPLSGSSALLLTAQHQSFFGKLPRFQQDEKTSARIIQNPIDMRYLLFSPKVHFQMGGGYETDSYRRSFTLDTMSHVFNRYKANISLSSPKSALPGTEWAFSFNWSLLEDEAKFWESPSMVAFKENLIRFKGGVGIRSHPDQIFGFTLSGSFANHLSSSVLDRGVYAINPYYQLLKQRLHLQIGVVISGIHNDIESKRINDISLYPKFEVSYQIVPNSLSGYAHIGGEDRFNDYQSILSQNRWLSKEIELSSSHINWDIQMGIKGKAVKHLGYHLFGQYSQTDNQYYFTNIAAPSPEKDDLYALTYTDEDRFSAGVELSWNTSPLSFHFLAKLHSYSLYSGGPALYRPKTEINLSARYQWRERIIISTESVFRGLVPTPDGEINGFLDIGLQLEYRFASWFGLYLEGKNLLNAEKQYYLCYLDPGMRLGGGITVRF